MSSGSLSELRNHPLVFVEDLEQPWLSDGDARHVTKSLRLRPGARLGVSDGDGRWRWVRLTDGGELEVEDQLVRSEPPRSPVLTMAFAPVKGDRSDLIVQKVTELGIDRIVPVHTARSVVRWDAERAAKQIERHRRIAREAAMQSRRIHLPEISAMIPLVELVTDEADVAFAEPGGVALSTTERPPRCLVIGPEGGFDPGELDGHQTVGLPGRILRSETAAIVGTAILCSRFE